MATNAAQPLLNLRARLGRASNSFLGGHPIDAVEDLFTSQQAPAPPVNTAWHDQQVRDANQSFRDAANQKPKLYSKNSMPKAGCPR